MGDDTYISSWNINTFLAKKYAHALVDFLNDLLMFDSDQLCAYIQSMSKIIFKLADDSRFAPSVTANPLRNSMDDVKSDFLLMVNAFFHALENLGDESVQHEVHALRGSVLKIIGVGEFDPRAKFVDPSLSLIVPSVLCRHCLSVRDIDLLRDEDILAGNWVCMSCKVGAYDVRVFERWLFEEFSRRYQAYQTQDMRCVKCQRVQARHLGSTCEDGGELVNTTGREELVRYMHTVSIAAKHHNFKGLAEAMDTYIQFS